MRRRIVINTDGKEIEIPVKATLKAMQIYRTEFGSDLSKDLNTVYQALNPDPFLDAMERAKIAPGGMSPEEMQQRILDNLDYSLIQADEPIPDEETQMKTLQIVWAMASAADKGLPPFEKWSEDLDMQPIRTLVSCLLEIWREANKTTVELKN